MFVTSVCLWLFSYCLFKLQLPIEAVSRLWREEPRIWIQLRNRSGSCLWSCHLWAGCPEACHCTSGRFGLFPNLSAEPCFEYQKITHVNHFCILLLNKYECSSHSEWGPALSISQILVLHCSGNTMRVVLVLFPFYGWWNWELNVK